MIAVNIGKTFLKAYNKQFETNYDAKTFFIEKYYPLFFDHEKYMQWITNSPFVQGIKKGSPPTAEERKQKLNVLIDKISRQDADASIAIGFPSLDVTATTSGQLSNLTLPLNKDDVYFSWIGSGFGIGVQGGLSIFFNHPKLLLDIFEGWEIYRNFLNTTSSLRGNQINTWNGQWITHRYNKRTYDPKDKTASFQGMSSTKDGGMEVNTQSWTDVLIGISYHYSNTQMVGYVYSLGQMNTTIGFIPFNLPQIRKPIELYEKYFNTSDRDRVRHLFGTQFGFIKACQMGAIGINALEPKGLREYLEKGKIPSLTAQDEEKTINFNTYQIWLLAMLNNEQLWDKAQNVAVILNKYAQSSEKGKKDKSNNVIKVLKAVNKPQFIESLTTIVEDSSEIVQIDEIAQLVNSMPIDNVPYFLTLIRFKYAVINK